VLTLSLLGFLSTLFLLLLLFIFTIYNTFLNIGFLISREIQIVLLDTRILLSI